MTGAVEKDVQVRLATMKEKARHPSLELWKFVGDPEVLPDVEENPDEAIPKEERGNAGLRRASLIIAATVIIDWCIDDIESIVFDDDNHPDEESAEDSFVYAFFPERHRNSYDRYFFRKVLVTAVKVAGDLADPRSGPAACTAEEVIRARRRRSRRRPVRRGRTRPAVAQPR